MAKYDVEHTCGHTTEVQLFGKIADRQQELARMALRPCRECARKAHESENEAAASANAAAGLPQLSGTPKQVAWAESIRQGFLQVFDRVVESAPAGCQVPDVRRALAQVRVRLVGITSASWWIENREVCSRDQAMSAWITAALRQVVRENTEVA